MKLNLNIYKQSDYEKYYEDYRVTRSFFLDALGMLRIYRIRFTDIRTDIWSIEDFAKAFRASASIRTPKP